MPMESYVKEKKEPVRVCARVCVCVYKCTIVALRSGALVGHVEMMLSLALPI